MDANLRSALKAVGPYDKTLSGDIVLELKWLVALVEASNNGSLTEAQEAKYADVLPAVRIIRNQLTSLQLNQVTCYPRQSQLRKPDLPGALKRVVQGANLESICMVRRSTIHPIVVALTNLYKAPTTVASTKQSLQQCITELNNVCY